MGIVAKQSVWNTITLFTGVLLGAVNTMLLYPMILESDQYGLTRIIVTVGILASQFSMMGMPSVLVKFLHKFRKEEGRSYGLLPFVLLSSIIGIVVVVLCMYFAKPVILMPYENSAESISDKYYLLFPMVLFITLTGVFSSYLKSVFHSVFQLVVSEIFMRLAQMVILGMYSFGWFGFDFFLVLFVLMYGLNSALLLFYLLKIGEFDLKFDKTVLTKKNKKSFIKYGIANFLSGIGIRLSNMIDVLMITAMIGTVGLGGDLGLKAVAIYSLAAYMSSVIEVPARAIGNIAFTLVGKAWAENNLEDIEKLYRKSAINQLAVGGLVFVGIWVNIDNIIHILDEVSKDSFDFSKIKYIVFFLGLAKLFHVASGINGGIINTSKYYLFGTYVTVSLVFITFITNWIFIPMYGIVGAGIATAISLFLFNVISFFFLLIKFEMQPYSIKTLITILIGIGAYILVSLLPEMGSPIIDLIIQSIVVLCIYVPLIIGLKVSEDITTLAHRVSMKFGIKLMK